jgi:hypothetical protein
VVCAPAQPDLRSDSEGRRRGAGLARFQCVRFHGQTDRRAATFCFNIRFWAKPLSSRAEGRTAQAATRPPGRFSGTRMRRRALARPSRRSACSGAPPDPLVRTSRRAFLGLKHAWMPERPRAKRLGGGWVAAQAPDPPWRQQARAEARFCMATRDLARARPRSSSTPAAHPATRSRNTPSCRGKGCSSMAQTSRDCSPMREGERSNKREGATEREGRRERGRELITVFSCLCPSRPLTLHIPLLRSPRLLFCFLRRFRRPRSNGRRGVPALLRARVGPVPLRHGLAGRLRRPGRIEVRKKPAARKQRQGGCWSLHMPGPARLFCSLPYAWEDLSSCGCGLRRPALARRLRYSASAAASSASAAAAASVPGRGGEGQRPNLRR